MKKIINDRENLINEMVEGIELSYPNDYERINKDNALKYAKRNKNKVSIVIGGGSGHEPMFFGFLGKGWADAVTIGNMFTAPNPLLIMDTAKSVNNNKGIIFLYGNHSGDLLNFGMASDLLKLEGLEIESVVISDDIGASETSEKKERRGVAGILFALKIIGAAAENGKNLKECIEIGEKVNNSLYTIGVGINPGFNPITQKSNFDIDENKLEFGIGVHGEPGKEIIDLCSSNKLSEKIVQEIDKHVKLNESKEIVLLVNGLGSFTLMEQLLISRGVIKEVRNKNVKIFDIVIGNFFTTNDMSGFSVSVLVMDEELKNLYKSDSDNPFFKIGG